MSRDRSKNKRQALCHPDRPHAAKGLCKNCYKNQPKFRRCDLIRQRRGMSPEAFEFQAKVQEYKCAICKQKPNRLVSDHDHNTGLNRELLCDHCNTALGLLKDDVPTLESAIKYLLKHRMSKAA